MNLILKNIEEHKETIDSLQSVYKDIEDISELCINTLRNDGTIFWFGNGGSSSDSQHLAAELIGRYKNNRAPLKSIALNSDTAVLTCISNDYSYESIFSRQVEALSSEKDLVIAISTSGKSKNVIEGLKMANKKNVKTAALLGKDGGEAAKLASKSIIISSKETARIQEAHILIGHILCEMIEVGLSLN